MVNYWRELELDLDWREAELASLKRQVILAPEGSVQKSALLRAMCALLYAHYEGFCKFAWEYFLDCVSRSGVKRKDCKDEIVKLSLHKPFSELREDMSADAVWGFCTNRIHDLLEEQVGFDVRFETSNLTPDLLIQHCEMVLLPHDYLDDNKVHIRSLIGRRHEIAHGKRNIISSIEDYNTYERAASLVMHEMAVAIVDSLNQRLYLR